MNWFNKTRIAQEKILFIARGPSGSGKSSMVKKLSEEYGGVPILSTDDYFMNDGRYNFDVNKIKEAHEFNQKRFLDQIKNNVPIIIIDNTNTLFWEMKFYVRYGVENGYRVEFVEPNWSSELRDRDGRWNVEFLKRMQRGDERVGLNKTLPDDVVERMVSRYQYGPTVEKVLKS